MSAIFGLDTIRRLLEEPRPVDWIIIVIELLVLALIAYEVGHDFLERRTLDKRCSVVMRILDAGVTIQNQIRAGQLLGINDEENVQKWIQTTNEWATVSNDQLAALSKRASYSFAHVVSMKAASYTSIPSAAQDAYGVLVWRLEKLHDMLEKPSAYF